MANKMFTILKTPDGKQPFIQLLLLLALIRQHFEDNSTLETVYINYNTYKNYKFGNSAFSKCNNLREVTLYGDYDIPYAAFAHCTKLTDVTLSDEIKSIGQFAFIDTSIKIIHSAKRC